MAINENKKLETLDLETVSLGSNFTWKEFTWKQLISDGNSNDKQQRRYKKINKYFFFEIKNYYFDDVDFIDFIGVGPTDVSEHCSCTR